MGARAAIYETITDLAKAGMAVVVDAYRRLAASTSSTPMRPMTASPRSRGTRASSPACKGAIKIVCLFPSGAHLAGECTG